jgi:hypothetical protein
MRMGRWQAGNQLRRPQIMSRGDCRAAGHPTAGGQTTAAATDAGATPGQPPMAKGLSRDAGTKRDREMKRAVEMAEVVESVEIQERDFPSSQRSLEISQKPRDSRIPTAPPTRRWKSGKPKAGFPLSHRLLLGRINKPKQQTASARKKGTLLSRYRIINATLRELAQLGVSKRTLFPDLAGLAEFVRWKHLHEVNGNSLRPSNERPPQ